MIDQVLKVFGFTELTYMIGIVCMVMLLGSFLGGLLFNIFLAHGGPIKPRKLFDRMSVRSCIMAELFLVIFAIYYHLVLIEHIILAHAVYWLFTFLVTPILAFIGAQISYLIFADKIESNKRAYKLWMKNRKAKDPKPVKTAERPSKARSARSFDPST